MNKLVLEIKGTMKDKDMFIYDAKTQTIKPVSKLIAFPELRDIKKLQDEIRDLQEQIDDFKAKVNKKFGEYHDAIQELDKGE